jgi:hypothetical protein
MNINFNDYLPDDMSDEAAYHLVNLFMELALALESKYFAQMKRYIDDNTLNNSPDYLK